MINFSDKVEIQKNIESFNNTRFLKFSTLKDREGVFRHVHFKSNEKELKNIEHTFGKKALKTSGGHYVLEFKRNQNTWI